MQIQCAICSDIVTQNAISDIIGLACGHIFHGLCLKKWLERSATCPQCRAKVTATKQFKIYITVSPEPEGQDIESILRTVDNLNDEVKLQNSEISKLSKYVETYKARATELVKEIKNKEAKIASLREISLHLNDMKKYYNRTSKELSEAKLHIESLENELKQYQTLKAAIKDPTAELDLSTVQSLDHENLFFLLSTHKKRLQDLVRMNNEFKEALSKQQRENLSLSKKNTDLQESISMQDRVIESLKDSLAAIKKTSNAEEKTSETTLENSIIDLLSDSEEMVLGAISLPPPPKVLLKRSNPFQDDKSETSKEEISIIKKTPLFLSEPSIPLIRFTNERLRAKSRQLANPLSKPQTSDFYYDGMGGHSKKEVFRSSYAPKPGLCKKRKMLK